MRHGARQACQGKQIGAGKGRAEGHRLRVFQRTEYREHQFADIHFGGLRGQAARLRFGEGALGMLANEVARACPGLNEPAILQQVVGLEHRRRAHAVRATGLAYRGHSFARGEHTAADQFGYFLGKFLVALHRRSLGQGRHTLRRPPALVHGLSAAAR